VRAGALAGATALLALAWPAGAGGHPGHGPQQIDIGGFALEPEAISVATGDTVIWVWAGPDLDHTVTADPGQAESFDSDPDGTPDHPKGDAFVKVFQRAGRYTYHCRIHPATMRGVINVIALTDGQDGEPPVLARLRVHERRRRLAFTVSEGAEVVGRIERRVRGRWRSRRDFDAYATRGRNRTRLPLRGLAPGRYRVRLIAYDYAGNRSRPAFARIVLPA
jgi:plastocyanin